jgi:CxxC motif-containing protein (DUF1111 family)
MKYDIKWAIAGAIVLCAGTAIAQVDPGVRAGAPAAGASLSGLSNPTQKLFSDAKVQFSEAEDVPGGLGPRFNLDSCVGCHSQPAPGGSSPATNPQIAAAHAAGATNTIPPFITANGPVREARFPSDGGVHDLFTITGRNDAPGCSIPQPTFPNDVVFRIPTPTFGLGLVQNTPDINLENDAAALADRRAAFGIAGHFNHTGNDGTITRFGWKAQNKSLLIFAGEAYNVEMGLTNDAFPNERDDTPSCQFNPLPEDSASIAKLGGPATKILSDVEQFALFMTLLAPPAPAPPNTSTERGRQAFADAGCGLCHTSSHKTALSDVGALNHADYAPFSDFQVHAMGALADGISQGEADGDEFRTAPLWGAGQRIFFLHDGRTTDLLAAIRAHASSGSEANAVISRFTALPVSTQQDVLNFLRGL